MSDALFDITPYGGPQREPKAPRPMPEPMETVAVTGRRWCGISARLPGVVHLVANGYQAVAGTTPVMSVCGLKVVPHTFDDREPREGCAKCAGH